MEGAFEVHIEDGLEVGEVKVGERLVAKDASVIDDDVDRAEGVEGGLGDGGAALGGGDGLIARDSLATCGEDLRHDTVGGARGTAGAIGRPAEVVDDDTSAATRELERVGAAETAPGSGDDGDALVERDRVHNGLLGSGVDAPGAAPRSRSPRGEVHQQVLAPRDKYTMYVKMKP